MVSLDSFYCFTLGSYLSFPLSIKKRKKKIFWVSFEFLFGTPKRGRGKDPLPTPTHTQRQERNALTALPCRRGSDQIYLRKQKAWFQLPAPAEGTTPNLVCLNNSLFYPHRFHEAGTWTETAGLCPMASGPQLLGRRAGQRGRNLPTLRRSPVWALATALDTGSCQVY